MALYRSPSHMQDELEKCSDNLELNLGTLTQTNPFLVVAIGHFNGKSKCWYFSNSATSQVHVLEIITWQFGLERIIQAPTHILDNSSACIDLISTLQPNLVTESGVRPSLDPNCHHQVVYGKFNLQI